VALAATAWGEAVTCASCHRAQSDQLSRSVHKELGCVACHGGPKSYDLTAEQVQAHSPGGGAAFDHGAGFQGKPARADIPDRCGGCHADVERMNPYGLRTDQLARYRTSVHGRTLAKTGDTRVAVCVDCHGAHDILSADAPTSPTNRRNVPATCGRCHADASLMRAFGLPPEIVAEYRDSVHGKLLLGGDDPSAPSCATCHGNHAAAPPGFESVRTVCGQCHNRTAERFSTTPHAMLDGFEGCLQCHGGGPDSHGHHIQRATVHPDTMVRAYEELVSRTRNPDPHQVAQAIHPELRALLSRARPGCLLCHEDGDDQMRQLAGIEDRIEEAERSYVRTARRLDEAGRGVLLVDDEVFLFREARTHLVNMAPVQHSLDLAQVDAELGNLREVVHDVDTRLDDKEHGLRLRHLALIPIWVFALGFAAALYLLYRRLDARRRKESAGDS